MTERSLLIIALRVAIIFLTINLMTSLFMLLEFAIFSSHQTQSWTILSFQLLPRIILIAICIRVWTDPSSILGAQMDRPSSDELVAIDTSELMRGALAVLGVYFLIISISSLFDHAHYWVSWWEQLNKHGIGKSSFTFATSLASDLVILAASLALIFRQERILALLQKARKSEEKPQNRDL